MMTTLKDCGKREAVLNMPTQMSLPRRRVRQNELLEKRAEVLGKEQRKQGRMPSVVVIKLMEVVRTNSC